jgi:hypothetical protein
MPRMLLTLFILAALVVPVLNGGEVEAAGGSKQLIIGGYNDALSKTATEYNSLQGGCSWWSIAAEREQLVSTPGTFSNLSVELSGVPGTNGYIFTLMVNNVATALTCTVAADGTTAIDNANTVNVVAGDTVFLRSSYADAPDNTPTARWSIQFKSDTANESLILGCLSARNEGTFYYPIMIGQALQGPEADVLQIIPTPGTIKNLYVKMKSDPGTNPDAYTITLRVNGVDTTLTTTVTADNKTGDDTAHEISVVAGDYVTLSCVPVDSPSVNIIYTAVGLTFTSDTEGEFLILGQSSDPPTNNQTEYNYLTTTSLAEPWSTTENYQGAQALDGFTLKKLYVKQSNVSGAGKQWDYTIRGGGGSTDLTVTIAGDTDTTGSDIAHTYTPVAYDDLAIMSVPTNSPTAAKVYWGLTGYIPGVIAPTLTTEPATDLAAGTFTLNGNLTDLGGDANATVSFQYGTASGVYGYSTTGEVLAAIGTFNTTIEDLEQTQTIYYRAVGTNTAGTGYGAEVSFTAIGQADRQIIKVILPIVLALAIILSTIAAITRNPAAMLTAVVIGIIAFYIVLVLGEIL